MSKATQKKTETTPAAAPLTLTLTESIDFLTGKGLTTAKVMTPAKFTAFTEMAEKVVPETVKTMRKAFPTINALKSATLSAEVATRDITKKGIKAEIVAGQGWLALKADKTTGGYSKWGPTVEKMGFAMTTVNRRILMATRGIHLPEFDPDGNHWSMASVEQWCKTGSHKPRARKQMVTIDAVEQISKAADKEIKRLKKALASRRATPAAAPLGKDTSQDAGKEAGQPTATQAQTEGATDANDLTTKTGEIIKGGQAAMFTKRTDLAYAVNGLVKSIDLAAKAHMIGLEDVLADMVKRLNVIRDSLKTQPTEVVDKTAEVVALPAPVVKKTRAKKSTVKVTVKDGAPVVEFKDKAPRKTRAKKAAATITEMTS